jgi:hypothetical protein
LRDEELKGEELLKWDEGVVRGVKGGEGNDTI